MAIPRVIHQTCQASGTLPPEVAANLGAIRARNPDWEHRVYCDADVLDYLHDHCERRIYNCARSIGPEYGAVLADLFRYVVVFREGGVYLDIKSSAERPLDEVLGEDDAFLLSQWRNRPGEAFAGWGLHPEIAGVPGGEFQQWHVIARARHPFLQRVIDRVVHNIEHYDRARFGTGRMGVLRLSGPICYTLAILPILRLHPARIVDIEDLGFRYTIHRDPAHHMRNPSHYSRMNSPIVATAAAAPLRQTPFDDAPRH